MRTDGVEEDATDDEQEEHKSRTPYIGSQLSIWKKKVGGRWQSSDPPSSSRTEGTLRDTIIARSIRQGNRLSDRGRASEGMSPFEAAQMEEFHASSEDRQNRSQQQNFERLAMVECFWEEAFPDSKFTKSLQEMRDWCDSGEKTKVIPIGQIGVTEYIAFVGYLTKTGIIAGLLGGDIEGRGCGFPTVEKINTIISWLSNQSNVTDPCCIDEVKQYVTDLKKKHTTRGAPSVDFVEFLPKLKDAVWKSDHSYLWKVQVWAMILTQVNMIARVSELCRFCPRPFTFPKSLAEYDADGWPSYVETTRGATPHFSNLILLYFCP